MMQVDVNAPVIIDFLDAIKVLNSECVISISSAGVTTFMADPGAIALINAHIPTTSCVIQMDTEEPVTIGASIERLAKIITNFVDTVVISGDDLVTFSDGKHTFVYRPLVKSTIKAPPRIPQLPWNSYATVSGKELYKEVSSASALFTYLTFQNSPSMEQFHLTAIEGDDKLMSSLNDVSAVSGEDATVSTPMDYMKDVVKFLRGVDTIKITMGTDLPLKLDCVLPSGLQVMYMVAPRIL